MNKEEIKDYLKRVDELEIKLIDEDRDTLQWLIFGYNECARLLNETEKELEQLKEIEKEHQRINGELRVENKELNKQLEYIRSGEYLNQLKFERNMLEDIVQNSEISKEDKEFIDMTHRNTELLEENQELKVRIDKAIEIIDEGLDFDNPQYAGETEEVLLEILKGDKENE